MAYTQLNHVLGLGAQQRAELSTRELLNRVDDFDNTFAGIKVTHEVSADHVERFADLLGDVLGREPGAITGPRQEAVRFLIGRDFGAPVNGGGWMNAAGPIVFRDCTRPGITLALLARIFDPNRIRQQNHPVCGPVVFLQGVCRSRPADYARMVTSLAVNGRYTLWGLAIKPGENVFSMPYRGTMDKTDYIALVSIRSSTAFWGYANKGNVQLLQGGAGTATIMDWLKKAGYRDVRKNTREVGGWFVRGLRQATRLWISGSAVRESLTEANRLVGDGFVVIVVMHGSLANGLRDGHFNNNRDTGLTNAFGGHYVLLESATGIDNDGATIQISTWGRTYTPTQVSLSKLTSWYWGYIAAKP